MASGDEPTAAPQRIGGQLTDEPALPVENHGLLIVAIMLASMLQVVDTTIANVAVPHMQSALGADPESIMWVLTSYMISSAVATPVTGWLSDRIGARQLFIISVFTFILASVLCGMAQNLEEMVLFRLLQGAFGAFIAPLSQSFMLDSTKPSRHAHVMSVWSAGMMLGPIMGPVVGGWLTENWNWRFVFYVNLPVGLISLFLLITNLPHRPQTPRRFDMFGFVWLSIALASLQLLLDRGNHLDWFASLESWIYLALILSAAWITVVHMVTAKNPLIDLRLFRDRNFAVAMTFMILLGAVLFSTMALLPPMLQHLEGYTVIATGLVLMPRGIGSLISTQVGGVLTRYGIDIRLTMATGLAITSATLYQMAHWSLDVDFYTIAAVSLIQGLGFGMIFIPINILAFATLPPSARTDASSVLNLFRGVGSSFGISFVTVLLARNTQVSHADLAAHIGGPALSSITSAHSFGPLQSIGQSAMAMVDAEISRQAAMIAYIDDYYIMFWFSMIALPLLLLLKPPKAVK